jgi:hypothetical protein
MRFSPYQCTDTLGTGLVAFQLLVPAGWRIEGGVFWPNICPGMPSITAYRAFNPQGCEAFELFPNQSFYWTNAPMVRSFYPLGSLYLGNEIRPPMGAQQMLHEIILPRFRSIPGLQVLNSASVPELVQQLRPATPPQATPTLADGAKVRVRYPFGDTSVDEEIYGVTECATTSMPSMFGVLENTFWMSEYLFSFKARAGQLDALNDLFQVMIKSFKVNPAWAARVAQISQGMIQNQIQQTHNIGQLSRHISQNQAEISDMLTQSYNQRSQVMERTSDQFSQAIRGVETVHDPNLGKGIELPNGYENAWSNPLGEYIVSNDANFNPNIDLNGNWTPLKKQE